MAALEKNGISMKEITATLLEDGVRLFSEAFDKLIAAVENACRETVPRNVTRLSANLPGDFFGKVEAAIEDWRANGKSRRLWARDASLWTGADEAKWLGWLGITEDQLAHLAGLRQISAAVRESGATHVLLLGMGGSSLAPEVLKETFGRIEGFPEFHVLDSTDPAQVKSFEKKVDLTSTLFIVSSKSGGTLEPNIFKQYFFQRVKEKLGAEEAGRRFVAITDPGSKLQAIARDDGFRRTFLGVPSIGGRYSALSDFGMVPAAVMGIDLPKFLDRTEEMVHACAACVPVEENPGVVLGAHLGVMAASGRDKLTLITSPGIWDLGAWLEQLVAESTGKKGKAVIPVDGERLGSPDLYGDDRFFVYLRLESEPDEKQDEAVQLLHASGQPVATVPVADRYSLGQEFFRWEIATAVAGSILGINPFDQPDVEASKLATKELTTKYEATGTFPPETSVTGDGRLKLYTDKRNAAALAEGAQGGGSIVAVLKAHLDRIGNGDYFALLAYVEMNERNREHLQAIRHAVRDSKKVATCLGFGPRFLHSTGQAYKGGPNTGVFLQVTCEDVEDFMVPDQSYSFGVVKSAQSRGDFQVLVQRDRRALRVHIGGDTAAGLQSLRGIVEEALA
jgi:transaldolase/glucose-6-phosphate isomerase